MTQHPLPPGDLFASLRAAAQAESARSPGAVRAVVLALVMRLCAELEQMFRLWQSRPAAYPAAPRLTRFAGLWFIPRAQRRPPFPDWVIRNHPARGLRLAPVPRPQGRAARAHPVRNAPH